MCTASDAALSITVLRKVGGQKLNSPNLTVRLSSLAGVVALLTAVKPSLQGLRSHSRQPRSSCLALFGTNRVER